MNKAQERLKEIEKELVEINKFENEYITIIDKQIAVDELQAEKRGILLGLEAIKDDELINRYIEDAILQGRKEVFDVLENSENLKYFYARWNDGDRKWFNDLKSKMLKGEE